MHYIFVLRFLLSFFPRLISAVEDWRLGEEKKEEDRTRMWADAQRDGRHVEYRWRPLFNAAKFRLRPLLECQAVTLPRRKTH